MKKQVFEIGSFVKYHTSYFKIISHDVGSAGDYVVSFLNVSGSLSSEFRIDHNDEMIKISEDEFNQEAIKRKEEIQHSTKLFVSEVEKAYEERKRKSELEKQKRESEKQKQEQPEKH